MIDAAGGEPVLADPGAPSRRLEWTEIAAAAPEVAVFMPCGYNLEQATNEGLVLLDAAALAGARRIFAVDGDALFSRPGPRVVEGVEALAGALHPEAMPPPPPGAVTTLR